MKNFTRILLAAGLALIGEQASAQQLLDNYENTRLVDYPALMGDTFAVVANPGSNGTNSSTMCASYVRDGSNSYASINMLPKNGVKFANVSAYVAGTKRLAIKIRSSLAAGTPLLIVLQNRAKATAAPYVYPQGNFSGYFNGTTAAAPNTWETVTFTYMAVNSDPTVTATDIDQLALYVAFGASTAGTFYLDDVTGPEIVGSTTATRTSSSTAALAAPYPNPSTGAVQLPYRLEKASVVSLGLYDMLGRRVATVLDNQAKPAGDYSADLNTASLAHGFYTCRLVIDGVALTRALRVE